MIGMKGCAEGLGWNRMGVGKLSGSESTALVLEHGKKGKAKTMISTGGKSNCVEFC